MSNSDLSVRRVFGVMLLLGSAAVTTALAVVPDHECINLGAKDIRRRGFCKSKSECYTGGSGYCKAKAVLAENYTEHTFHDCLAANHEECDLTTDPSGWQLCMVTTQYTTPLVGCQGENCTVAHILQFDCTP